MKNTMHVNYWGEATDKVTVHHVRSRYDSHPRLLTPIVGESKAMQSAKDECDINKIVPRALKNGTLAELIKNNPGQYADFSDPVDYQEAMNLVIHAQAQFDALPAKARDRFGNDPQEFLRFAQDPSNEDEMVTLGLAVKRPRQPDSTASNGDSDKSPKKTPPVKPEE